MNDLTWSSDDRSGEGTFCLRYRDNCENMSLMCKGKEVFTQLCADSLGVGGRVENSAGAGNDPKICPRPTFKTAPTLYRKVRLFNPFAIGRGQIDSAGERN